MEKELQHHNESLEAHLESRLDGAVRNITDLLQISGAVLPITFRHCAGGNCRAVLALASYQKANLQQLPERPLLGGEGV